MTDRSTDTAQIGREMQAATDFLYDLPRFTKKNSLAHTQKLMHLLGDPCADRRIIHVAGSNGKGSVCNFLSHMLLAGGFSVGMFTSPHLVDIRERFQVNGRLVTEEEFLGACGRVTDAVRALTESGEGHPAFFEFVYAMAMAMFEEAGVEYVVLETGLGGRLDATNSFPTPALTVITPISLEHTEILGGTIGEIAGEKAGILKPGVPVVYAADNAEAAAVIAVRAAKLGCPAAAVRAAKAEGGGTADWLVPGRALYQAGNAALAIEAMHMLPCRVDDEVLQRGLSEAAWPGRMQEVFPDIWVDGAHNPAGIAAFLESVRVLTADDIHAPLLLFSMLKEKDHETSVGLLAEGLDWAAVAVAAVPGERGASPERLAGLFEERNEARKRGSPPNCRVEIFRDCREAFGAMRAQKRPGQKLFCTGSLHFIGALL